MQKVMQLTRKKTFASLQKRKYLFGLVGNKNIKKYSLAPKVWDSFFKQNQIAANYFILSTDSKSEFIESIKKLLNLKQDLGFNVAMPWKNQAFKMCDWVEPLAKRVKVINTVIVRDGKLYGYNTDGIGLTNAVLQFQSIKDKKILLLGAGGAAQTLPYYFLTAGCKELYIYDLLKRRSERLASTFKGAYIKKKRSILSVNNHQRYYLLPKVDIIINATPCGMVNYPKGLPISNSYIRQAKEGCLFVDMIYNPPYTRLLSVAKGLGFNVCPGIYMLVEQAALSFSYTFHKEISQKNKNFLIKDGLKGFLQ
jgi:shikimate dehydrogenase